MRLRTGYRGFALKRSTQKDNEVGAKAQIKTKVRFCLATLPKGRKTGSRAGTLFATEKNTRTVTKDTMKKKKYLVGCIVLAVLLCLACATVLVSCSADSVQSVSVSGPKEIRVGDFEYSDFTLDVVYESGNTKKVALEKSMLSKDDNIKFFESGLQKFTVNYEGVSCEFSVQVCLYEFEDLHFTGAVVDEDTQESVINTAYTGKSFSVEVFDNYPEGTVVYYKNGNSFTNAGTYTVTAIVSRKDYVTKTLTATVNVAKADYVTDIKFADSTVEYDGKEHSIAILGNLPDGVSVEYEYVDASGSKSANSKVNAGVYTVWAKFSGDSDNYNKIEDMSATLTIEPKRYDTSSLAFDDASVTYDKQGHSIQVSGCPAGVSVEYKVAKQNGDTYVDVDGTEVCNAGKYLYTATFTPHDKNYAKIEDVTAILTINSADYDTSGISLQSKEVVYDGKEYSIDDPTLDEGWEILYRIYKKDEKELHIDDDEDKDYVSYVVDSGIYEYTVCVIYKDNGDGSRNYNAFELRAMLTIGKATYDVSKMTIECGTDENGVMRAVLKNVPTDADGNALKTSVRYFESTPNDERNNYIKDGENPADGVTEEKQYFVEIQFLEQDNVNYEYLGSKVETFIAKKDTSGAGE